MIERPLTDWLPITKKELSLRNWNALDVILISGDAYVDHPAFGPAVIGRLLEADGLRVALVPQPNWQDDLRDFKKLGKPKMFFGVTSGCMDSMVNHYTANNRLRSTDAYTPGGQSGFRPDYAATIYANILKKLYPEIPIVLGGIEASLRRVTHYDYWSDQLKPSILIDSKADLLVYGMGEKPLLEIIRLLKRGVPFESLNTIPQTAVLVDSVDAIPKNKHWEDIELNSHEICLQDKKSFAQNFKYIEQESNRIQAKRLLQQIGNKVLVVNPPFETMSEEQIDHSFDLPYTRLPHPKYKSRGAIPAYDMIKFSINMHRGCFGGCSFCTISAHQGKFIASRSEKSIMKEVEAVTQHPEFKGYISDLGGPSANMYKMQGKNPKICENCVSPSCIHPTICYNLDINHAPLLDIYRKASAHPNVKKAFVSSGIRYDLCVPKDEQRAKENHCDEYIEEIVNKHVSGRLKVAPEHTSDAVLKMMRKPSFRRFYKFKEKFDQANARAGKKQKLIPYFISAHPGCELEDMANLAAETKSMGFQLEQVQGFTPTPMTVATVIYYSGYHPYSLKPVYTARNDNDKIDQNRFFFWYKREHKNWIQSTLKRIKRTDLIADLIGKPHRNPNQSPKRKPTSRKPA